nr:MAG TPA: hypothetical protein [Caudoviricetes sp.]
MCAGVKERPCRGERPTHGRTGLSAVRLSRKFDEICCIHLARSISHCVSWE